MAEVLVQFDEPCRAASGREFIAQVCGQSVGSGLWEGWIQFMPSDGGDPVRTRRETEQFSRGDLRYWAATLSRGRIEEALQCALRERTKVPVWQGPVPLVFDDIDPEERIVFDSTTVSQALPVLDPFMLYAEGPEVLRRELRMLDAAHLRAIVSAYNIPEPDVLQFTRTLEESLAHRIVAGVQQRVEAGHPSAPRLTPRTRRFDSSGTR